MIGTTNNLHDKYVKTDWIQLWADDHVAVVLRPIAGANGPWEVLKDNHRALVRIKYPDFSSGIDAWNDTINQHLSRHSTPGTVTHKIQYDYQNQAYVIDGLYVRCNHPATMDCNCYGKLHADEVAELAVA